MSQSSQVFNISAGPAVLPASVLEIVQQDLLNLADSGMSILELKRMSEPLPTFQKIIVCCFCKEARACNFLCFQ